jgi:hypothetical protein
MTTMNGVTGFREKGIIDNTIVISAEMTEQAIL